VEKFGSMCAVVAEVVTGIGFNLEVAGVACRWVWVCSIADERWGLRAN
jgi:hypothetical protein